MHAHIDRDHITLGHKVYLFERGPSPETRVLVIDGSPQGGHWVEVPQGGTAPVSLNLPADVLEAIVMEAEKVIPASHATERHLQDVIRVRDRLLTMVERAELIQVQSTTT